jgi:hypothetical protein
VDPFFWAEVVEAIGLVGLSHGTVTPRILNFRGDLKLLNKIRQNQIKIVAFFLYLFCCAIVQIE